MSDIAALHIDFDAGGSDGTTIPNAAAIGAGSVTGTQPAWNAAEAQQGSFCLICAVTGVSQTNVRYDFGAISLAWFGFYLKTPAVAPTTNQTLANWFGNANANAIGTLRLNADMTVAIRDINSAVFTSATPLPTNTWCRFAIKASPGSATGHRLRVYIGNNRNGNVPDTGFDSGDVTATNGIATNIDTFHVGPITGGAMTVYIDRLRGDNASEPAGLSVAGPPTVNAGPDLTKQVGSSAFPITAVDIPAGGDTITSRNWSIVSGVAVSLANSGTDTVTITPPVSTTGSTVLRFTSIASGGTASDDVTLTWTAAGQTLRPASDVANNGWVAVPSGNLFAAIRDAAGLDATNYILCPAGATTQAYRTRLDTSAAPTTTTGWYLDVFGFNLAGVSSSSTVFKLYESDGTTLRKTFPAITDFTTSTTNRQLTLTTGEIAAITSWASGLILEMVITVS